MSISRISIKIGVSYAIAFLASILILFGITSYLLLNSLQSKDHDLLQEKLQEYATLFARDGVRGLQTRVSSKEIKHARDFVVRLSDKNGKTLFIHSPDRSDDEDAPQLAEIDKFLHDTQVREGHIIIPGGGFGDDVELVSRVLPTGEVLQVGKDTEDREAFYHSFLQSYLQGLIPLFILAIAVGIYLANRLLNPIRTLTQTVKSIRSGNPKARVKVHSGKDELQKLATLFNEMLEQNENLVQGMKDTVDNVAHDLRTPIMRLQNSIEGALRGKEEIESFREALISCQENSEMILKLINGIMDISEAEAGTLKLNKESLQISTVVNGVLDLYGFVAEDKNIKLVYHQFDKWAISADKMRLLQVVSNLVDNAIKYSNADSTIAIETRVVDGFGIIEVKDEGIGMLPSEYPRIWDRLYRVDSSRTSRGLGLGLSLVKAITQAHNGTVHVSPNSNGKGSVFSLKFPI